MDELTRRAFARWTQAQPAVSAFVHALVADRAERDDVLQEVALAVLEAFPRYDETRPFLPWALGVARNVVHDAQRKRRGRPALLDLEASAALADAVAEVAEHERERLTHLAECLQRLEGRAREACELRYRRGLKPARIAELLGMSPNTAAKLLQRVREQLRECIEQRLRAGEGA